MHITHVYIITFPFFQCQSSLFIFLWHKIRHALSCPPIIACGLFKRCSRLGSNTDLHNGFCHLWHLHHSLSYGSFIDGGPGSKLLYTHQLSSSSLLDLGHFAAFSHHHLGGGTECLEVCLNIQRWWL